MTRDVWTVLPVRGIHAGKSRLAPVLDEAARARLSRWLVAHTLAVLRGWYGNLRRCVVVSRCAEVFELASSAGATVLCEADRISDQNHTAALGASFAFDCGARRIMALPCDLPELAAESLDALVAAPRPGQMILAPDAAGTGTNAVVFDAGAHVRFHFGAQSCARYMAWAAEVGLAVSVRRIDGIAFDLDTPQDLSLWLSRNGGHVAGVDLDLRGGREGPHAECRTSA